MNRNVQFPGTKHGERKEKRNATNFRPLRLAKTLQMLLGTRLLELPEGSEILLAWDHSGPLMWKSPSTTEKRHGGT